MDERAYQNLLARLRQQLAEFDSLPEEFQKLKNLDGVTLKYGELRMLLTAITDMQEILNRPKCLNQHHDENCARNVDCS